MAGNGPLVHEVTMAVNQRHGQVVGVDIHPHGTGFRAGTRTTSYRCRSHQQPPALLITDKPKGQCLAIVFIKVTKLIPTELQTERLSLLIIFKRCIDSVIAMGKVNIGQLKVMAVFTSPQSPCRRLVGFPPSQCIRNLQTGSQGVIFGLSQGTQLAPVRLILAAHDKKV